MSLLVIAVEPAFANSTMAGDSLVDTIVTALKETIRGLVLPIKDLIEHFGNDLVGLVITTPYPNTVFERPSNGPWPDIYGYYWSVVVPLALSLYGLSIGLVIFLESTSHLFSSYHRSKLKKRALSGLFGILSWWWLAAISLRFVSSLTGFLVPDLSTVTLFQTYSFSAMGLLGVVIALSTDFVLFALLALIYLVRQVVLYMYVLVMPLLFVLWIPGVGPFATVAGFMKRLGRFYVPFLFMTLPVAMLFRLGQLLGGSFGLSMGEFGAWITGLVLPFLAVASPLVFFWQASALFFVADRSAHRIETRRARQRLDTLRRGGRSTVKGGRDFVRGVRSSSDGESTSEDRSRSLRTGRNLRRTGSSLGGAVNERLRGPDAGDQSGNGDSRNEPNASGDSPGDDSTDDGRSADFDNLRPPRETGSTEEESTTSSDTDEESDDPPRYIH